MSSDVALGILDGKGIAPTKPFHLGDSDYFDPVWIYHGVILRQKAVTLGQWLPWPGLFWVHLVVLAVAVLLIGVGRLGQRWGIR